MAAIQSLMESFGVLKRNPVVFWIGALYGAIIIPQSMLSRMGIPILPVALQIVTFFVTPFALAGLLGMVYEGRVRGTRLVTFVNVGKKKYDSVLVGNLIRFAIQVLFTAVAFLLLVFTIGLSLTAVNPASKLRTIGLTVIALFGVIVLLYLLLFFFLQFYTAAIVVDNVGAIEGYRRSIGVVMRNPVQTLGFSVLHLLVALLLLAPALVSTAVLVFGPGTLGGTQTLGPAGGGRFGMGTILVLAAYSLVTMTAVRPLLAAFSVSFYDNHSASN